MSDANLSLRDTLAEGYDSFLRRLKRRLGSTELAEDVLHDTYLRLAAQKQGEEVRNPTGYIMRAAFNVARDRVRADKFRNKTGSLDDVAHVLPAEFGDAARQIEARSDLSAISRILKKLPARRRAILLAACLEGVGPPEIAKRFGLSVRTINAELQLAREFCAEQCRSTKNI